MIRYTRVEFVRVARCDDHRQSGIMNGTPPLPSDRQLVDAARSGHDAAWHELMERHGPSIRSVLPQRGRSGQRFISQALDDFRETLDEPTPPEGEVAIRAFRPRALAAVTGGSYGPASVDPAVERIPDDRRELATAFGRHPEPWQTGLWHTCVERFTAAEVSPLVGRTANEVTELLSTAERGLVDAYLLEYQAADDFDEQSAALIPLLSGYVRSSLPAHEQRIVEAHLADDAAGDIDPATGIRHHGADDSRRLIEVASSVPELLAPAIAPGITGMSVEAHRAALGTATRSFGTAAMSAERSNRVRRAVVVGSVIAVVLVLVGVAYLVRQPFDNDDTTSTSATTRPDPATSVGTTVPSTDPGVDPTVPSTTGLDLRPAPSGPNNEIELIVDDALAAGFVPNFNAVTAAISSPAPVLANGTGTLDITLTNDGSTPFDGGVEMVLPRGVVFDALVAGPATCVDDVGVDVGGSVRCDVDVASDESTTLSVRLGLASSVVGRLTVVSESLPEPFVVQIDATRDVVHNSVGRGGIDIIGNTVMTCDEPAAAELEISCSDVLNGVGSTVNRWDVPMEFTGAAPAFGFTNGSSAVLDIADDARIVHAELFWSGDLEEAGRSVSGSNQNMASFVSPTGEIVPVEAEDIVFGEEDATQYVGRADVTDLVAAGGPGEYLVGNITSVEVQGSYGAWALAVVTDDDNSPRRYRVVTDPFDWVAPEAPFSYAVDMPVPVVADGAARLSVVAYEGEVGFLPETLLVGGSELGGTNPFDSSVEGTRDPTFVNNLGVDIGSYDLTIDSPAGTLRIDVTSAEDGIRLAVLGLSVDLVE
jgi:hypothetical protein